jgi:hypothetical protein
MCTLPHRDLRPPPPSTHTCLHTHRSRTDKTYETVDDIDFMADLQRVEEDRLALIRENELLQRQQVCRRFSSKHMYRVFCSIGAQGIPKYKIGLGGGKDGRVGEGLIVGRSQTRSNPR